MDDRPLRKNRCEFIGLCSRKELFGSRHSDDTQSRRHPHFGRDSLLPRMAAERSDTVTSKILGLRSRDLVRERAWKMKHPRICRPYADAAFRDAVEDLLIFGEARRWR